MGILTGSALIHPWAFGWAEGYDNVEVSRIIEGNDAGRAVVEAAGGVDQWVAKTDGGKLNPDRWPFALPVWPPPTPKPSEDRKVEPGEIPAPGTDPALLGIQKTCNRILTLVQGLADQTP